MNGLLTYSVPNASGYILLAVVGSLCVRAVSVLFQAWRATLRCPNVGFCAAWIGIFLGYGYECQKTKGNAEPEKTRQGDDYLLPFVLGVFELLAYPILIVNNQPVFIGAWIAFKIVHRVKYAPDIDRGPYNRFLVANGMILVLAYCIARFFLDP